MQKYNFRRTMLGDLIYEDEEAKAKAETEAEAERAEKRAEEDRIKTEVSDMIDRLREYPFTEEQLQYLEQQLIFFKNDKRRAERFESFIERGERYARYAQDAQKKQAQKAKDHVNQLLNILLSKTSSEHAKQKIRERLAGVEESRGVDAAIVYAENWLKRIDENQQKKV